MKAEFLGGSAVSRVYNDTDRVETIAVFAYDADAVAFVKATIANEAVCKWYRCHYLVACSFDGRVKIFRHEKPKTD